VGHHGVPYASSSSPILWIAESNDRGFDFNGEVLAYSVPLKRYPRAQHSRLGLRRAGDTFGGLIAALTKRKQDCV
jgi:hypothetical protein